jgi:outer membrane protein assembly factor BamD (BamD/ComL family)
MRTILFFALIVLAASCKSPKQKLTEKIESQELSLRNTDQMDPQATADLGVLYMEFVSKYPDDTLSARYLFKAAEMDHRMGRYADAVALFKQFTDKNPQHAKAPTALFLQAFLYETELHNKDSAKILYAQFLEKYPNHELAPSAKATLDQLEMGLTDEELVKMFESRMDTTSQK